MVRLRRTLVFDVFSPDFIGHITPAGDPVSSCPQVLAPVPFPQAGELRQQLVGAAPLEILLVAAAFEPIEIAKLRETVGYLRVSGAEYLFVDGKGPLAQWLRLTQAALHRIEVGEVRAIKRQVRVIWRQWDGRMSMSSRATPARTCTGARPRGTGLARSKEKARLL